MARCIPSPGLIAAALALCLAAGAHAEEPRPAIDCESAGTAAEQRHGIPAGLLNAIGRVESGRRDPLSGRVAAWPWAINAEGRGRLFDSQSDALAGTRALQAGGVASIDVGCFQVNLVHHRTAFTTLEEGFDPARNADYAGRFLASLRDKVGSWEQAVANYHSATPERGIPYRDRVLAGWMPDGAASLLRSSAARPAPPPGPIVVRMVSWVPQTGGGMRIWTPSAPGQGAAVIVIPGRLPRS